MTIKQGLVNSAETNMLLGRTDLGDINGELSKSVDEKEDNELATHVLCFMMRGMYLGFNDVIGYFPSKAMTFP